MPFLNGAVGSIFDRGLPVNRCLLILCVSYRLETWLLIKTAFETAGHRVVFVGASQAVVLVNNGFEPDILLVENAPMRSARSPYSELFSHFSPNRVWLLMTEGENCCRIEALGSGIHRRLSVPVTRADVDFIAGGLTEPEISSCSVQRRFCFRRSRTVRMRQCSRAPWV